jgi:hypothetical protein
LVADEAERISWGPDRGRELIDLLVHQPVLPPLAALMTERHGKGPKGCSSIRLR